MPKTRKSKSNQREERNKILPAESKQFLPQNKLKVEMVNDNINHLYKKRYFVSGRQTKARKFVDRASADPEGYGQVGTSRWIDGLLQEINEPGVITSENVRDWMATNPVFFNPTAVPQQKGLRGKGLKRMKIEVKEEKDAVTEDSLEDRLCAKNPTIAKELLDFKKEEMEEPICIDITSSPRQVTSKTTENVNETEQPEPENGSSETTAIDSGIGSTGSVPQMLPSPNLFEDFQFPEPQSVYVPEPRIADLQDNQTKFSIVIAQLERLIHVFEIWHGFLIEPRNSEISRVFHDLREQLDSLENECIQYVISHPTTTLIHY